MNSDSKIIGEHRARELYIDGFRLDPLRSRKIYDHSIEFSWGYLGSGCAQTALALLLEAGCSDEDAELWHQEFKTDVVASLRPYDFAIEGAVILNWIENKKSNTKLKEVEVGGA